MELKKTVDMIIKTTFKADNRLALELLEVELLEVESSVEVAVDIYLFEQTDLSGRMIHASSTVSMFWLLVSPGVTQASLKFM